MSHVYSSFATLCILIIYLHVCVWLLLDQQSFKINYYIYMKMNGFFSSWKIAWNKKIPPQTNKHCKNKQRWSSSKKINSTNIMLMEGQHGKKDSVRNWTKWKKKCHHVFVFAIRQLFFHGHVRLSHCVLSAFLRHFTTPHSHSFDVNYTTNSI